MEKTIAVERSIWINAPREQAWRAVTEAAQLDQWYATFYRWEIPAMQAGTKVKFYNKDNVEDFQIATIEVVDPPRQFSLRWQPYQQDSEVTLVTNFLLIEENAGTRVTIHEGGYETLSAETRQQWLDATGHGYTMSMENLKAHLEGRSLPY
ncbi:MAG: SRPBCC domain-containing protein [Chloroflexota bacterium]|nr:SRPBCC domain-containing protein [Anaerolineae bacterium]